MTTRILITGSAGLVGTALRAALHTRGHDLVGLDLRGDGLDRGDVRDPDRVRAAVRGCAGVVHLAAISRVVWGERDPALCRATNLGGLETVLAAIEACPAPPWLIFASSREVYGRPDRLPVDEDAPLRPVNVYARTKADGEAMVTAARARGVRTSIVRLSNVYGGAPDHHDRVVPAFVRAAIRGTPLHVEGSGQTFDLTHLDDTVRALVLLVARLGGDAPPPPPIHLVTGRATTLAELAALAVELAAATPRAPVIEAPARTFDVAHFVGDPRRAAAELGWTATIAIRDGVARYLREVRAELIRAGAMA